MSTSKAVTESPADIRVVAGHPTDEELAALVVALGSIPAEQPGPEPSASAQGWSAPWRGLRKTLRLGTDAWRFWGRS
ncbi:MAG TPA: acyl-CoA carboxylase subunit epsilon [Microlunatus sp.]